MHVCVYMHTYVMKNRPNFEDALHGSAVLNERTMKFRGCSARECDFERKNDEILRMLCTGVRFSSKFSGCSAREHDFEPKNDEISRMLRTGAGFSKFSGCSARESDLMQNFRMLRTGARSYQQFSGCSAREHDCIQNFAGCSAWERDFLQIFRMLCTGARFSSKLERRSDIRSIQ